MNNLPLKLKGGCVHHDNGLLGAASLDRAEARKIELLKANGYNAVRCAHNPPAEAFLRACDEQGMLVIDEALIIGKKKRILKTIIVSSMNGTKKIFRQWC